MTKVKKKNGDQTKKKTLRELRRAALRVGWLSRCWGDKKNCDKTQKLKLWKKNLETQIVTTQKLKFWKNSKTQIVTKLKTESDTKHKHFKYDKIQKTQILTELKKENCDKTQNSNCDKTQKLKLQQNLKTQIVTKLENTNCDKTKKIKRWQN